MIAQDKEEKQQLINTQVSLITRDKDSFVKCANRAGIKIHSKFTVDQAASLKEEMPFTLWRTVKRAMAGVFGPKAMQSEREVRQFISEIHYQYECGSFEATRTNKLYQVTFVRVTKLQEVVTKMVDSLRQASHLTTHDNIVLMLSGDKGSTSTKLLSQVMNTKSQHAVKLAKVIAVFEGAKDCRESIEKVNKVVNKI